MTAKFTSGLGAVGTVGSAKQLAVFEEVSTILLERTERLIEVIKKQNTHVQAIQASLEHIAQDKAALAKLLEDWQDEVKKLKINDGEHEIQMREVLPTMKSSAKDLRRYCENFISNY